MAAPTSIPLWQNKNWAKCGLALEIHLKNNLLEILHNKNNDPRYVGLPKDPTQLYNFFQAHKSNIGERKRGSKVKHQFFKDQLAIILPPNGNQVDSQDCDITLITGLIEAFITGCPFHQNIKDAREFRNNNKHGTLADFDTEQKLQTKLAEVRKILAGMNYSDLQEFDNMVKDDNYLIDINEGTKHLSNLMKELERDLKDDFNDKIELEKKNTIAELIKMFKPRLKGTHLGFQEIQI